MLHVFFGGTQGSVPIVWTLNDDVARLDTGFRRGSGVIFDNLEPLQDVLSADRLEQPLGDKLISKSVKVDDMCRKDSCEGEYKYRLIVYDRAGIARIGKDPGIKNHPN